jgi:hypothetical protein
MEALRMQAGLNRLLQAELEELRQQHEHEELHAAPSSAASMGRKQRGSSRSQSRSPAVGDRQSRREGLELARKAALIESLEQELSGLRDVSGKLSVYEAENHALRKRGAELADARIRLMNELERSEAEVRPATCSSSLLAPLCPRHTLHSRAREPILFPPHQPLHVATPCLCIACHATARASTGRCLSPLPSPHALALAALPLSDALLPHCSREPRRTHASGRQRCQARDCQPGAHR